MRYHLPPPPDPSRPRAVAPSAPVGAPPTPGGRAPVPPTPAEGRIARTVVMPAAQAATYLGRWRAEPGGAARPIDAPAGVAAHERSRPDRTQPGGRRRQRLAVMVHGGAGATALHWSAPEPLAPADEQAWERALARLAARDDAGGGWRA